MRKTANSRVSDPTAAPSPAARAFALLEGSWSVERTIEPGGRFVGTASFTLEEKGVLIYRETGTVTLANGRKLSAKRSYHYRLRDDLIEVRFHDGSNAGERFVDLIFPDSQDHPWPIETASDTHVCRLDRYDAVYRLDFEDLFQIVYFVHGPQKDYVSRSTYRRLANP